MKKIWKEFFKRGLIASACGPIVVAIIYAILGSEGVIVSLTPKEVSVGIISSALMAFIAAGVSVVYIIENLPLIWAIFLHAGVLYADYLGIYLLNDWLPRQWDTIAIFTIIYMIGYAIIWLFIYLSIRKKAKRINQKLKNKA
ncbi:MAG: DUF3021 domain-containing protein [Ruminococcaceae bacterium]|nr:DUF3021 domain-containing protein [Oscillospiraceae bacterium]